MTLRLAASISVLLFTSCSPRHDKDGQLATPPKTHAIVEIHGDDGSSERREILFEQASDLEKVRSETIRSGHFIIRLAYEDPDLSLNIEITGSVHDGAVDGVVEQYLVEKQERFLTGIWTYARGIQEGLQKAYYPRGIRPQFKGDMVNGLRDGEWSIFYPSGGKAAVIHYQNGKLDGPCTCFSKDGNEIASGVYNDGRRERGTFVENLDEFSLSAFAGNTEQISVISTEDPGQ